MRCDLTATGHARRDRAPRSAGFETRVGFASQAGRHGRLCRHARTRLGPLTELWKKTAAAFAAVPPAVYGAILLVVAIVAAMIVHRMLLAAARRALAARHPEAHALLTRMQGPLLLALVLLAVSLELPALPFDPDLRAMIGRILQLAFICLAGWMTLVCLDVSSAIYLRRFDLGAQDNLLAR